jgi:hypothetical protein
MGLRLAAVSAFVVVLTTLVSLSNASAQSQRLRGEVESVDGTVLTLKTHDGKIVKVMLEGEYSVNHAVVAKLTDLTPGTFVGVGAFPDGDGLKAAHVQM